MKKTFLENMFRPSTTTGFYATVVKRVKVGRYQLRDDSGGLFHADSSINWTPGSRVAVQGNRIVAGGGSAPTVRTYKV
jgi:hypothetical protein